MATTPYISTNDADTYFAESLGAEKWTASSSDNKGRAVKMATRLIDTLPFVGYKTDENQENEFPRNGENTVPLEVQRACAEIALELLKGNLPNKSADQNSVLSESTGDASRSYAAGRGAANFGLPSVLAARFLAPWIEDDREVELIRV